MTRRDLLRSVAATAAARAEPGPQPNVVLWTDPAALQAGGAMLTRAYAANPEVGPALAAIVTGRFPHACGVLRDGMTLPSGERCLVAALQKVGYQTAFTGRWPLGPSGPARHGFELWSPDPAQFLRRDASRPFFLHIHGDAVPALAAGSIVVAVRLFGKEPGTPLEASVRVPMTAQWPAPIPADRLISHVDLMPTLLAMCGAEIPKGVHGRNLAGAERAESVFAYGALGTRDEWRMIVRGLDKLVVNAALEVTHLYNLGQDPDEVNNLAPEPGLQRTRDELTAHMTQWMRRIGDRMDQSGLKVRG